MRTIIVLVLISGYWLECRANVPPVVNAGVDTEITLSDQFRLQGQAIDDGTPDTLLTNWSIADGPADGAQILVPAALRSRVVFSAAGNYAFVLEANDGEFSVADTIRITVAERGPFVITSPGKDAEIQMGSQVLIAWRRDPISEVILELSVDNGISYQRLLPTTTKEQQFLWNVPADMSPSDNCLIKVTVYIDISSYTISEAFSIVPAVRVTYYQRNKVLSRQSIFPTERLYLANGRLDARGSAKAAAVIIGREAICKKRLLF